MQMRGLIATVLGGLLTTITSAQTLEKELDPVTVTSGLTEMNASRTGRNILVIKGDRFQHLPVNSVDDLLRYLPGLEVQARGPMGAQSDIIIRGGTFQQVLVVLDGIRLNDPLTGHFNSYIPIAPAEIDRIEILKGAASAIYGSEAVGGVIHIITKSFNAKKTVTEKSALAKISAGKYDLLNAQAGGFYNNGITAFGAGILSNNSNGQELRGTKGYFNLTTASLSIARHLSDKWQVAARSSVDDRKFSAQNFYTTFASDTATESVKSFWNHVQAKYGSGRDAVTINLGLKTTDDHFLFNNRSLPNLNKSKLWQALVQERHSFSDRTSVITGLQFFNRNINSNDRGVHNENQAAGFVLLHHTIASGFSFSPALRLDWNEQRGTELIPQAAFSYLINRLQLRASLGKTIRDADFTERYNNYNKALVTGGRIGNPDLKAEKSFNYEGGLDYFFSSAWKFSGTFFQRFHKQLIDYVPTAYADMPRKQNLSPTGSFALAKNIASVNILGAETDIQYTKILSNNKSISGGIGTVWLDVQDSEAASAFYLSSFAKYLINFNLGFSSKRFNLSTTGVYKQRQAQTASAIKAELTKNYFVLNGKAEFMLLANSLGLFVQTDNIFDKKYSDFLGARMPERWVQFGARYSFKK